jgi:phage I-like protein
MSKHNIKSVDLVAFMDTSDFTMPMPEGQSMEEANKYMEQAPKEILIIPYGKNPYTIDGKDGEFECDENDADNIITNFNKRGKEIVIDREHATLNDPANADANGWIKILIKKDNGIYGQADWQPDVARKIVEKKLRYLSPVIDFNGKRPFELHSVALTNHPAMHSPNALAASDTSGIVPMGDEISANLDLIKALTNSTNSSLKIIRECYSDLMKAVKDKPERASEVKAFADTAFPEMLTAFADATDSNTEEVGATDAVVEQAPITIADIPELQAIMQKPKSEAIVEVETLISIEDNPARKSIMLDVLAQLEAMPDEALPTATNVETPIDAGVTEMTAPETTVADTEQSFCDIVCKETGLVAMNTKQLIDEIQSLKPVAEKAKEFLSIHKFSDFSKATATIMQKEIDSKRNVESIKEDVALNDSNKKANELVQKALNDKKILGVQKDSIMRWAMSDYTAASAFIANQKPIFGSASVSNNETVKQSLASKTQPTSLALSDLKLKLKRGDSLSESELDYILQVTK